MFLTGRKLKRLLTKGEIKIEPFDEKELTPYGYWVHFGNEVWTEKFPHTTSSSSLFHDVDCPYTPRRVETSLTIPPHRVIFVSSLEKITIPEGYLGVPINPPPNPSNPPLVIQTSTLPPKWEGKITVIVYNPSPYRVKISVGDRLFVLSFQKT